MPRPRPHAEDGYDEVRQVWNGSIQRRPAAILQCAGAADVVYPLEQARHVVAGWAESVLSLPEEAMLVAVLRTAPPFPA